MHVNRILLPYAVNRILNRIARIHISCHTRRRAGSVIANPAKVVLALQAAVVQGLVIWYRSGQSGGVGRYVVNHPVDPGLAGGVRIVHYQGDGLCACRDGVP